MINTDKGLTIEQAAQIIGKSALTVRRAVKSGKLKSCLVDGKYLISQADLPTILPKNHPLPLADNAGPLTYEPTNHAPSPVWRDILADKDRRIEELNDKLISASGRLGWLQRELEGQKEQVKLLTAGQTHAAGTKGTVAIYRTIAILSAAGMAAATFIRFFV